MPNTQEILSGLHAISNEYASIATAWHILFYLLFVSLLLRWKPGNRIMALFLCLPLASVAFFAWFTGNPFNGMVFSVFAILALMFGIRAPVQALTFSKLPFVIIGTGMVLFGIIYPHFLETDSVFSYLISSPAGLIPCPTLSIIIGLLLLYNGFASPALSLLFIVAGLFYGLFGVLKLGVTLDLFLLLGTLTLLGKQIFMWIK